MANQTPEQRAAITAFAQWYGIRKASDAELEAAVARFRAEERLKRDVVVNLHGVRALQDLQATGAKKGHVADALGISRPTLYRLFEGIEAVADSSPEVKAGPTAATGDPFVGVEKDESGYHLTVRDYPATFDKTVEATGGMLNFEGVPLRATGLLKSPEDEVLPLNWEIQRNTVLREEIIEKIGELG